MLNLFFINIPSIVRVGVIVLFGGFLMSCSKPVDQLMSLNRIALVSVEYDPTIYTFEQGYDIDTDIAYAEFTGSEQFRLYHERNLNQFLTDLMTRTTRKSGISIVRPLTFVNTSLMNVKDDVVRYEYLLEPYDPIDINNRVFMAGIANRMNVDAVVKIMVQFAVSIDETSMWTDFEDRTGQVLSYRQQLKQSHDESMLRSEVTIIVVDKYADLIYSESRFVNVSGSSISVTEADLKFPGGISPRLLMHGLKQWLNDWELYLPDINN